MGKKFGFSFGLVTTLVASLLILPSLVFATSGACSGHHGVDCSAGPDSDGSVICVDGWTKSSVQYSSMVMCKGAAPLTTTPTKTTSTPPTSFSDVLSDYKYAVAVSFVKDAGIVNGYPDGTYQSNNKINRAEFTKILVNYPFPNADLTLKGGFVDVSGWSEPYICLAKQRGIIDGYPDHTFKPDQSITVPEVLKISLLATQGTLPGDSGVWYQKYLTFADNHSLRLPEWRALDYQITRGEMAELIKRIHTL